MEEAKVPEEKPEPEVIFGQGVLMPTVSVIHPACKTVSMLVQPEQVQAFVAGKDQTFTCRCGRELTVRRSMLADAKETVTPNLGPNRHQRRAAPKLGPQRTIVLK